MKKTAQTLLTAAMFATALGSSAAGKTPAGIPTAFAAGGEFMTTTTTTGTTPVVLYGPPWVLSSLEAERQKTATTTTVTTALDYSETPLSGTYNLHLSVRDDITGEYIPDLECELFQIETGKTVARWNSSDDPEQYIKKLKYEFEQYNAFGSITYGVRIRNLPENYSYTFSGNRDYVPVSGDSLTDFAANGTELATVVYLKDSLKTTAPFEFDPTGTTTVTTETEPVVLYGPPWVFYPTGDANMDNKTDARDLTIIKQLALGKKKNIDFMEQNIADIDHDGDVDRDDVDLFMHGVLGIPEKEEDPAVTTAANPDIQSELETTTRATDVVVLYGPPSMMQ
ncbi:MAG: hypothetical protein IKH27_13225 [Oscillospiraceae bacterium]|nr:hypothetical protein [Oscillospiraceae bacterium]